MGIGTGTGCCNCGSPYCVNPGPSPLTATWQAWGSGWTGACAFRNDVVYDLTFQSTLGICASRQSYRYEGIKDNTLARLDVRASKRNPVGCQCFLNFIPTDLTTTHASFRYEDGVWVPFAPDFNPCSQMGVTVKVVRTG